MNAKSFKIKIEEFKRRKKTIIQHKLRVVLKCYTVFNFNFDEDTGKFTFIKSYKVGKKRIDDKKTMEGFFETEEIDDEYIRLKLTVL